MVVNGRVKISWEVNASCLTLVIQTMFQPEEMYRLYKLVFMNALCLGIISHQLVAIQLKAAMQAMQPAVMCVSWKNRDTSILHY